MVLLFLMSYAIHIIIVNYFHFELYLDLAKLPITNFCCIKFLVETGPACFVVFKYGTSVELTGS